MPTFALNFYSPVVADQLRTGRKTATIRLGDKSPKYKKGMIVTVLVGTRYGPREKIFDAVIDKVEVKPLGELSPREIEHDNPEIRRVDELARWLGQLYNREVSESDTVTVIRFSQIIGTHVLDAVRRGFSLSTRASPARRPTSRPCGSGRRRARAGAPRRRTPRTRRGRPTGTGLRTPGRGAAPRPRSRARGRELGLELDEVPEREAAVDAERDPVAERLAALLLDPVPLRPLARSHATEPSRDGRVRPPDGEVE